MKRNSIPPHFSLIQRLKKQMLKAAHFIRYKKWYAGSLLLLFSGGIVIYSCNKIDPKNNSDTPLTKADLPNDVAVYVSYEAETSTFSEIVNNKDAFKHSENIDKISTIPHIQRMRHEVYVYKNGDFKMKMLKLTPKQNIRGIVSLSPQAPNAESVEAVRFEITPKTMNVYNRQGELLLTQAVNLPDFKELVQLAQTDCFIKDKLKLEHLLFPLSISAKQYFNPCFLAIEKRQKAEIAYDKGIMVIRKPLLKDNIPSPKYKGGRELTPEEIAKDPDNVKRQENIDQALAGKDPSNKQEIKLIDTSTQQLLGQMLYEGNDKLIMTTRYKHNDKQEIEASHQEVYETDPITNSDKVVNTQTVYENVQVINNL